MCHRVCVFCFIAVMLGFQFNLARANSGELNVRGNAHQLNYIDDYFNKANDILLVKRIGVDVQIIPSMELIDYDSYSQVETVHLKMDGKKLPMYAFYGDKNIVAINDENEVVFLQIKLNSSSNAFDLFEKLNGLKYLSIISKNEDVIVNLSGNYKLKEVVIKSGKIEEVVLPENGMIETIVVNSGAINKITNLSLQDGLSSVRINGSVNNLTDLHLNDKVRRLDIIGDIGGERLNFAKMNGLTFLSVRDYNLDQLNGLNEINTVKYLVVKGGINDFVVPRSLEFLIVSGGEQYETAFVPR